MTMIQATAEVTTTEFTESLMGFRARFDEHALILMFEGVRVDSPILLDCQLNSESVGLYKSFEFKNGRIKVSIIVDDRYVGYHLTFGFQVHDVNEINTNVEFSITKCTFNVFFLTKVPLEPFLQPIQRIEQ